MDEKKLWQKACVLARTYYEALEEKSWDDADKYEREDYFFYVYSKLKENKNLNVDDLLSVKN